MLNFITLMVRLEIKFQLKLDEKEIKTSAVATVPVLSFLNLLCWIHLN